MKKLLYLTIILLWLMPAWAYADIIYLKDGTKVKAGKVWEEGDVIRFSLEDYEDIIITYSKEIVERIEKNDSQPASRSEPAEDQKSAVNQGRGTTEAAIPKKTSAGGKPSDGAEDSSKRSVDRLIQKRQAEATAASPSRQSLPKKDFQSDMPAETAPAETTAKPGADIVVKKIPSQTAPSNVVEGILFYNPRRTYKYWTGPNTGHHTLKGALEALAKMFNRSPEWVARNLGNTNNLGDIYRNLSQSGASAPAKVKRDMPPKGVHFYDPRRPYKYWTSQTSRHRSLNKALEALAKQYNRPVDWVRAHIGNTNELAEIHKNLTRRKAAEAQN